MRKLFIANTTKHHKDLYLRIPEVSQLYAINIPHGEQREIYPDPGFSNFDEIEITLRPLINLPKPFCVSVAEASKQKGFAGLIWSVDKPVPKDVMEGRMEQNADAQNEASIEQQVLDAQFIRQAIEDGTESANIGSVQVAISAEENGKASATPERVIDVVPSGHKAVKTRGH
jgi:hypothetical protein